MDLFVRHEADMLGYYLRAGKIAQEEHDRRLASAGYFFSIAGKHRPEEAIKFFVAIQEAGMPVVISDADEILARFEGTGYIGIVPHRIIPRYCENLFPERYGRVIDFMHIYHEEEALLPYVEWLPEEEAKLRDDNS